VINDTRIYVQNDKNFEIAKNFVDFYGHDALECENINGAWIIKGTELSDKLTILEQIKQFQKNPINAGKEFYIDFLSNGKIEKTIHIKSGKEDKIIAGIEKYLLNSNKEEFEFHEFSSSVNYETRKNKKKGKTGLFGRGVRKK
jgi:hypothetical protein